MDLPCFTDPTSQGKTGRHGHSQALCVPNCSHCAPQLECFPPICRKLPQYFLNSSKQRDSALANTFYKPPASVLLFGGQKDFGYLTYTTEVATTHTHTPGAERQTPGTRKGTATLLCHQGSKEQVSNWSSPNLILRTCPSAAICIALTAWEQSPVLAIQQKPAAGGFAEVVVWFSYAPGKGKDGRSKFCSCLKLQGVLLLWSLLVPLPWIPHSEVLWGKSGKRLKGKEAVRKELTFMDGDDVGVVEGRHDLYLPPDMDKVLFIFDSVLPDGLDGHL